MQKDITETMRLTTDKAGKFWLWDGDRGMNLVMRADTIEQALTEALFYYQSRLNEVLKERNDTRVFLQSTFESLKELDAEWDVGLYYPECLDCT